MRATRGARAVRGRGERSTARPRMPKRIDKGVLGTSVLAVLRVSEDADFLVVLFASAATDVEVDRSPF